MATTDASGALTGTYRYDPYGNKISSTLPDNTADGIVLGWAGVLRRATETTLSLMPIQMGARVYLPGVGRFTQMDPVPGGNANDYVYAVDPINTNDFSGRFLQGGAGAGFLQPAAGAPYLQPAAPAPYYQPAAGLYVVQSTRRANLTVVRNPAPVPKPRDTSTRLPVASVVPMAPTIGYLIRSAEIEKAKLYEPPSESGYMKFTIGGSFVGGAGVGLIYTNSGSFHLYSYATISTPRGLDATWVFSNSNVQCGSSISSGGFWGLGGNVGPGGSQEVGFGTPGVSTEYGYVHC